jgi:hypothetical protein
MSDRLDLANPPTGDLIFSARSPLLTESVIGHFGRFWTHPGSDRVDSSNGSLPDENGPPAPGPGMQSVRPWAEVIDELRALHQLEDDWDGQGAKALSPDLVDGAIALALRFQANAMRPADFAVAGVNGTVIFEWHDATHYLEIEVTAPDRAEGRAARKGAGVTEVFTLSRRS